MKKVKITPYSPKLLPLRELDWEKFIDLLGAAYHTLGKFEEILQQAPYPYILFSLLQKEEVLASMQGQNLKTNLKEIYSGKETNPKIAAYEKALHFAIRKIKKHPLSPSFMRQLHMLIKGGENRPKSEIGRYRVRQNWIGFEGCKIEEGSFFPPAPQRVPILMKNLFKYLRYPEKDKLVQLALFFAQLLNIHPFMDGNGRVGRLLLPLFLYKEGLLSHPLCYFSRYFEEHRMLYFDKLFAITGKDDWEGWIRFFLEGIIAQGEKNCQKAASLLLQHNKMLISLSKVAAERSVRKSLRSLFLQPIFEEKDLPAKIFRKLRREKWIKVWDKKEKRWIAPSLFQAIGS